MAEVFPISEIVTEDRWIVLYDNAEGYQDKFYDIVRKEVEKSNFPNLEILTEDFTTGGLFFNRETTRMIKIKAKKSQFKKMGVYFRAQAFGNTVVFSKMDCMETGIIDILRGKTGEELLANVRSKCKNWAQYEEFTALRSLGDLIFTESMKQLDPAYKDRKMLIQK